jgi:hypothetical protein
MLVMSFLFASTLAAPVQYYRVTGVDTLDVLNVREKPNASAKIVGALSADASCVAVLPPEEPGHEDWQKIEGPCGESGWVNVKFLSPQTDVNSCGNSFKSANVKLPGLGKVDAVNLDPVFPGVRWTERETWKPELFAAADLIMDTENGNRVSGTARVSVAGNGTQMQVDPGGGVRVDLVCDIDIDWFCRTTLASGGIELRSWGTPALLRTPLQDYLVIQGGLVDEFSQLKIVVLAGDLTCRCNWHASEKNSGFALKKKHFFDFAQRPSKHLLWSKGRCEIR